MKNTLHLWKSGEKGRPDYYIAPSHDFTQYTRDCEEKYWNREKAFDWHQNVRDNLKAHLENLNPKNFSKVAFMTLPIVEGILSSKIFQIKYNRIPADEDALKDIAACLPFDNASIQRALSILSPLTKQASLLSKLQDQATIIQRELSGLQEQQRLGLISSGVVVKQLEWETERQGQSAEIARMTQDLAHSREELRFLSTQHKNETKQLKTSIRKELNALEAFILADLEKNRNIIRQTIQSKLLPLNPVDLNRLKDLILKQQLKGLKDIANHALVVEQSAIAPLTTGVINYKRHREIQEAMTTFVNDEAKHSATFRRFLAEKLEAREFVSSKLIKGANRYMWIARFMPGTGMFMAVAIEAIGASVLEFFGNEKYMPDPLFCSICKTISSQDEKRHMDLCTALYNELYRKGHKWETNKNKLVLKLFLKAVYGDKTEDHRLIQAFRSFGVESSALYGHITNRLSQQLARIGLYIEPDTILEYLAVNNVK